MKQNKPTHTTARPCKKADCLAKELCAAINFEEQRSTRPPVKADVKDLYGAEAQSYYFHFHKAVSRA